MYVKRFTGRTTSEALTMARRELGEETLLLGIRRRPGEGAEVTVAIERPAPSGRVSARAPSIVPPRPSRLFVSPVNGGGAGNPGSAEQPTRAFPLPARAPTIDVAAAPAGSRKSVSVEQMFAEARAAIGGSFGLQSSTAVDEARSANRGEISAEARAAVTSGWTAESDPALLSTSPVVVIEATAPAAVELIVRAGLAEAGSGEADLAEAGLAEAGLAKAGVLEAHPLDHGADIAHHAKQPLQFDGGESSWERLPEEESEASSFTASATGRGYEEPPVGVTTAEPPTGELLSAAAVEPWREASAGPREPSTGEDGQGVEPGKESISGRSFFEHGSRMVDAVRAAIGSFTRPVLPSEPQDEKNTDPGGEHPFEFASHIGGIPAAALSPAGAVAFPNDTASTQPSTPTGASRGEEASLVGDTGLAEPSRAGSIASLDGTLVSDGPATFQALSGTFEALPQASSTQPSLPSGVSRGGDLPSEAPSFALSVRARSRAGARGPRAAGTSTTKNRSNAARSARPSKKETGDQTRTRPSEASEDSGPQDHLREASFEGTPTGPSRIEPSPATFLPVSSMDLPAGRDLGTREEASPSFSQLHSRSSHAPSPDADDAEPAIVPADIHAGFDLISQRIQKLVEEIRKRPRESGMEPCVDLPPAEEIMARLASTGLQAGLCEMAARAVRSLGPEGGPVERVAFLGAIRGALAGMLTSIPAEKERNGPRILALIGPAGTGKTTMAMKLAAKETLSHSSRVVLVGTDHRRIGALEPLRECSEAIDAPLEIVTGPAELQAVLARRPDVDLVIIDTPGLTPSDSRRMFELERLLEAAPFAERLLVLSATTRAWDIERAVRRFSALSPLQLVFTKMDETNAHGELLGEAASCGRPVTWFGTGPSIPDDLEKATPERFAEIVVGGAWPA